MTQAHDNWNYDLNAAPRDTRVLVYGSTGYDVALFSSHGGRWVAAWDGRVIRLVRAWQTLPAPPQPVDPPK